MLDFKDKGDRQRLANAITKLNCEIELPKSWAGFFDESGLAGGDGGDNRRFPRWRNRVLAGLFCQSTFPALCRSEQWHPIYLKDVSQGGVALIHSAQLYPLERIRILLVDDHCSLLLRNCYLRAAEVRWCRRIQAKCYEIGACFVTT